MVPMPVVFYLYGKKIRAKSKFAPSPDIEQERRLDEEARMGSSEGSDGLGFEDPEKERQKERGEE
jgi:MFS transporter, DHA1 family, multidrug resistance protein